MNEQSHSMTISDALFARLGHFGVRDVFMLSGGSIMYLVDALGRATSIRAWCNYHEQACAIAAESYARVTGRPGVCLVTAGPGATNALSAVAGSWVESIPVVVISGQVRRDLIADYSRWRQIGPQETNIIAMARPVTKYAEEITDPDDVLPALDVAWAAATTGRPGPVWLSIPLDVQGMELPRTQEALVGAPSPALRPAPVDRADIAKVNAALEVARRPVIAVGNGIHLSRAEQAFDAFVRRFRIPVVAAIGGMDVLSEEHPCYFGRFGPTGQRRANFVLQNSDLLLCLGTSLSVAAVGFNTNDLAPKAQRFLVNIDPEEMTRPHLRTDVAVVADVGEFMVQMMERYGAASSHREAWLAICGRWKRDYPVLTDDYAQDPGHVNSYLLAYELSRRLHDDDVILTGNSLDAVSVFHSYAVKPGQRVLANTNFGAMGWDVPALVGACVARPEQRAVLVTGDGSILLNSQELLTVGANCLNAKIFVLNNGGYQSIRSTQQAFCGGRLVGCDQQSGVSNPLFEPLAAAYGLEYTRLERNGQISERLASILDDDRPWLVEVEVAYEQERIPRLSSRRREDGTFETAPLHDQYPFLPREEMRRIMSVSNESQSDGTPEPPKTESER